MNGSTYLLPTCLSDGFHQFSQMHFYLLFLLVKRALMLACKIQKSGQRVACCDPCMTLIEVCFSRLCPVFRLLVNRQTFSDHLPNKDIMKPRDILLRHGLQLLSWWKKTRLHPFLEGSEAFCFCQNYRITLSLQTRLQRRVINLDSILKVLI